tara:strand:- start:492 stop:1673 length:1182 start_codon:yes stop_codon:yes gene_type:complete
MNKEFRLNLYLSYAHALSDSAHIIFGLTLYFVSDNLNISILTMGFIYNLSSILRGVSGVSAGILSDKSNFLYWIILFGALSTLGCLVLSISNNTNIFTIGIMILAIGSGIYHPVGLSAITKYTINPGKSFGYHGLGGAIGISLAPWFFINISSALSWQISYLLYGFLTIPIMFIYFDKEILNLTYTKSTAKNSKKYKLDIKNSYPIYLFASLKDFGISGLLLMLAVFINTSIMNQWQNINDIDFFTSIVSSLIIIMGGFGSFIGGHLDSNNNRKYILIISCLISGLLFMVIFNHLNYLIIIFSLISFLTSFSDPSLGNWLGSIIPKRMQGTSFALMYGLGQIIGSFSGSLAGIIVGNYNTITYFKMLSIPLVLASLLIFIMYPKSKKIIKNLK